MTHFRDSGKKSVSSDWTEKLAGNNTLQKTMGGMPVYTNKTGDTFFNMTDLRQ